MSFNVPRRYSLAAGLLSMVLLTAGCGKHDGNSDAATSQSYIERAEAYRKQGQYRAALIEARNAIDSSPSDDSGKLEMAALFNDLAQAKQALKVLDTVSDAHKGDAAVIHARADALLQQGKYRSALTVLQQGNTAATDIERNYRIAQAKAGLGPADEARPLLKALLTTPRAIDARLELARLELSQNDEPAANEQLQEVLKQQPDNIEALTLTAQQAERNGNLPQAESTLSQALIKLPDTDVLLPEKIIVLRNLINILTKQGRSTESLIYAKLLNDANPEGVAMQNRLKQGMDAFTTGKLDEAEKIVTEVYEDKPIDHAGILLGMIKYAKGDYAGASNYLGMHLDPEIASDEALTAFAASEVRLRQPQRLLEMLDPEQREHVENPQIRALVGAAMIQAGDKTGGEKELRDAVTAAPDNVPIRSALARHYLVTGQAPRAIKLLEEGIARKPDAELKRMLVSSLIVSRNMDEALKQARAVAALKPEQASNLQVLGRTALLAKQYDASAAALNRALQLQPDYRPAKLDLAQLALIRKQYKQAQAIYREMVAANANDFVALRGFIKSLQMDAADASTIETAVLQLTPSATARAVLAEYYLLNRHTDEAQRVLDAATEDTDAADATPDTAKAYAAKVRQFLALKQSTTKLQQGDTDAAREIAFNGLRVNPRNIELLALLGQIEIASKAYTEAEKVIDQIAQIKPDLPILAELRGKLAAASGDRKSATEQFRNLWNDVKNDETGLKLYKSLAGENPKSAAEFLDEWQRTLPDSDMPLFLQGMQQQQTGNLQQAAKSYESAIAKNSSNVIALNNLAIIYADSNDARALATAEKAYNLQPKNAAVVDTLGWILVKNQQPDRGIKLLEQASELQPDDADIKAHLEQAKKNR